MTRRLLNSKIWTNEKVACLPFGGRLLFIALITHADDDGRLKGSPRYLKALCFPYDDVPLKEIQDWLDQLSQLELTRPYSVNGNAFLLLTGWSQHQSIRQDRYSPSFLPPPDNQMATTGQPLVNQVATNGQPTDNHLATSGLPSDNQVTTTGCLKVSKVSISKDKLSKSTRATPPLIIPPSILFSSFGDWPETLVEAAKVLLELPLFSEPAEANPAWFREGMERLAREGLRGHDPEAVLNELRNLRDWCFRNPDRVGAVKDPWRWVRNTLFRAKASRLRKGV